MSAAPEALPPALPPAEQWPGRAFRIAVAHLEALHVPGDLVVGHYTGHVSPACPVAAWRSGAAVAHAWIEAGERMLDPCAWVFAGEEHAPAPWTPLNPSEYRRAEVPTTASLLASRPEPSKDELLVEPGAWPTCPAARAFMQRLAGGPATLRLDMLFWFARLPVAALGRHALAIYQALELAGYGPTIPHHQRELVLGVR